MKSWLKFITVYILGILVFSFTDAFAQWRGDDWRYGHGMMMGYGYSWLGFIIMSAFWICIIVMIIFLIRWLIKSIRTRSIGNGNSESAMEILKKRYAKGEINKDEYEQKKRDIIS